MSVANMTFMVDRLGADCAPGQFIRELTENAIAGIELLGDPKGEIVWDVDWTQQALAGIHKLCIIDTGVGMSGPEMVDYINKLSSSVHQQSTTANFGIGAKISAAPLNHAGIVYLSWKDGVGSMIHLWRDPATDSYGLQLLERPDGTYGHWAPIEDTVKPVLIKKHGTMVVLMGNKLEQNTMEPPSGVPMPAKWILRYLNGRYFRFQKGVTVRVREGHALPQGDKHNFLRAVDGMHAWLEKNAESMGKVPLESATAHWWIIKDGVDVNSGHVPPPGHVAALYQDELYDVASQRSGTARLQALGVIFGTSRVVVYVEPDATKLKVEANTARTTLMLDGQPLPWAEWCAEFRNKLPKPLVDLVEEIGAKAASSDHRQSIRERLKSVLDLYRLSRFKPSPTGPYSIDPNSIVAGGRPSRGGQSGDGGGTRGGSGGRGGSIYSLFVAAAGDPAAEATVTGEPNRKWISVEAATRTPPDLDDRAAKFIPHQNLLLINGDFRVFIDMIAHWTNNYSHAPGSASAVKEVVREWFEQQLVESVMGAQSLRGSREWTMDELEKLWSPEALTAVVIPRWHINGAIARVLGAKLGSLKNRTEG